MKRRMSRRVGSVLVSILLLCATVGTSPALADEPTGDASALDCIAAIAAFTATVNQCATAAACIGAAAMTGEALGWACIGTTVACMGLIAADVAAGDRCLQYLNQQASLNCQANGGYAIWDQYTQTYLCLPLFEGVPPGYDGKWDFETVESDGLASHLWWPNGWGPTPGGGVALWCCYEICDSYGWSQYGPVCMNYRRICNPC